MFAMFKIWAILALAAPFASALDIISITGNAVTGGSLTITWSTSTSDAAGSFSVELFHESFHDTYAIATNVDASTLSKTIAIPEVPAADGYYIQLVDISDVNTVFSTSQTFSIGAESATQSVTVKESATPTGAKTSSGSLTGSASQTGVPISTKPIPSSSNTASSAQTSQTAPSSSGSSSGSAAPSTTAGTGAALAIRGGSLPGALLVALGIVAGAFAL
ncbi:hypothetical protein MVEN_00354500 [Mycena venus]|uniref:Yeast cell wall synthesis Kre9/Knh1-like N-terminal domain-containing protein n=1 Tax=Mycena venus TaxID=2733690 RepID=A0A8H7D9U0_9AGAR|nr:hypothetical protein MVEN_00354500 [Mycena venus]